MGKLLPVPYPGQSMDEYRELLINFQKNYWSFLKPSKGGSKFIPLPPLTLIKKTKEMSSRKLSEHVEDELFNKEKRVTVDPKKVIKTTPKIVKESVVGSVEPKMVKEYTFGSVPPPVKKKKPYYRKKYDKSKPVEVVPEPTKPNTLITGFVIGVIVGIILTSIIETLIN
jgi:hypothetical protein